MPVACGRLKRAANWGLSPALVKPQGTPSYNAAAPLARGLLFCGVDNGSGTIVDVTGGRAMDARGTTPSSVMTANGKAIHWPAAENGHIGYTADVDSDSVIRTASHLADKTTGVGFTFACTHMMLAQQPTVDALIFGRPAHALEAAPYVNWVFLQAAGSNNIACSLNNNGTAINVGSSFSNGGANVCNALVCTVINTAPGVATARFYANGSLVGSATTGLVVADSAINNPGQDGETQIMFGAVYHVETTFNFNCINGVVYCGMFWNRALDATEVAAWSADPYGFLVEPPVTIVSDGVYNAFPGLAQLPNGTYVCFYRVGSDHVNTGDGNLVYRTSQDFGKTWSGATTYLTSASFDQREANIIALANGNVFVNYYYRDRSTQAYHSFVVVGTPNANRTSISFGTPVEIGSSSHSPYEFQTGGAPLLLANGTILVPVFWRDSGDTFFSSGVVSVSVSGTTPTAGSRVTIGQSTGSQQFDESCFVQISGGRVINLIRHDVGTVGYDRAYSDDNGATWSTPAPVIAKTSAAENELGQPTAILRNGIIWFIARGGTSSQYTVVATSNDEQGTSWPALINLDSTYAFMYSAAVLRSDGVIGCVLARQSSSSYCFLTYMEVLAHMATVVFLTSGTSVDTSSLTGYPGTLDSVETIGGGGGGSARNTSGTLGGPGGGGGAYSKITSLTVSGTLTYQVGAGGAGGVSATNSGATGTDTWFNGANLGVSSVGAKGGAGGTAGGTSGGAGGASGSGVGTTKNSGGNGGGGPSGADSASGGGGGAGPNGVGKNGGNGFVAVTVASGGGGGGGNGGGANGSSQTAEDAVGAAGGAAQDSTAGGAGGSVGTGTNDGGAGSGGSHGSGGGGGGPSESTGNGGAGGVGGNGVEFDATHGSGGGGGGGGARNTGPGAGGNGGGGGTYGGGGGGGAWGSSAGAGGNGANGLIVLTYTPAGGGIAQSRSIPMSMSLLGGFVG